ncbi:MAG: hypothetical protein ACLGJC_13775 [Alphaproteobacteria bacterium]
MQQPTDNTAIAVATTAPGWASLLSDINTMLTTVSLVLGIAFLIWRWHRSIRQGNTGEIQ